MLVAAPAGFGKTSVLTEWLSTLGAQTRVSWLSLDERDDDATLFWTYLLASLDRAGPGVASASLELLASGSTPLEAVLATLVNDLHADGAQFVLVLDDFHVVENQAVHAGITFLIDNLPANVHLVISSRTDPALPLGRLRARGELIEIRAADLRFTPSEASAYLNDVMDLAVGVDDVATLSDRTEGWIAALQLAALSMQGRSDAAGFIAGFAGDDRYVVDYLVEEVLQRQPSARRTFLLETSILGRLSGELCDAVTRASGSGETLEALDRANLFLVPLDDHREWYRYHHLFAEMLRARLLDERRERVRELHLRASEWFEQHGQAADAIGHAIDAEAFDRAAALIKIEMPTMQQQRQELTLVGWLGMLPAEVVRADPELAVGYAGAVLSSGRTDGVDRLLHDAETAIGGASDGIRAVRNSIALYRAAQALTAGDLETALEQSGIAVGLSENGSHIDRGSSNGLRGLVLWAGGDLESARATWAVSIDELEKAGHLSDTLGGSIALGDILSAQGRLTAAEKTYRRGIEVAAAADPPIRGAADMHVGMADLLRERGDLEDARRQLDLSEALGEYAGLPQNRHRHRMVAARLLLAEGAPAAGIPLLDEAELLYTPDFFPEVRPIAALRARVQLAAGRESEAREWARHHGVRIDDELSYLREYDHITLARVLLADAATPGVIADVLTFLERLLRAAEDGGRQGVVIELLILQSLTRQRGGRDDDALTALGRAVVLAEPEGYVRLFADEGRPIAMLIAALAKRDGNSPYLRRLHSAAAGASRRRPSGTGLPDPLSEREIDVVRLLASDLSGPEIARHLVVSLNTLRTHTKNIYAKLGATSRREAVRRAGELGLLNSPG